MRKIRLWLPVIFWMALIFFLSSRPSTSVSSNAIFEFLFFKGLHIIEYGVLFVLVHQAVQKTLNLSFQKTVFLSLLLTIIYGISDEIHQLFVPTREGRLRDVFIDAIGAFLGNLVIKKKKP